jgi:hypothetical protein
MSQTCKAHTCLWKSMNCLHSQKQKTSNSWKQGNATLWIMIIMNKILFQYGN